MEPMEFMLVSNLVLVDIPNSSKAIKLEKWEYISFLLYGVSFIMGGIHPYVKEKEYTFGIPNNILTNYTHQQNTSQYGTFNALCSDDHPTRPSMATGI